MVINTLTTTASRHEVIDITYLFDENQVVAVYKDRAPDIGWLSFLKPLKVQVKPFFLTQ